jgi:hypothetical protein
MNAQEAQEIRDNRTALPDSGAGPESFVLDAFEFQRASQCPKPQLDEIVEFLDTQDTSHPFQLPAWGSDKAYFATYRRDRKIRWFAQCFDHYPSGRVMRPIHALVVNRGPVSDDLAVMEAGLRCLVETARKRGAAFVDIAPDWTGPFGDRARSMLEQNRWHQLEDGRTTLRLDLTPDVDQLLASFRKVTRYEIRKSERCQVMVRMASDEADMETWLRLYQHMAEEKQFSAGDCDHLARVLRWLRSNPIHGGLLLAEKDGKLTGGIVIVRSGARCWYVWGATSKNDEFSAGHLLQWRALQWAKENGCREYDFLGYREGSKSGVAFFKRGFCDNVVRFIPASRYVLRPGRYRISQFLARVRRSLQPVGAA